MVKLYSWNVNGIRAVMKKDMLLPFLDKEKPDILCLQEIKANEKQIAEAFGKSLHLSGVQGADEQRTEMYMKYSEGAAQSATQQSAKNASRVGGFADKQAGIVQDFDYAFWYPAEKPGYSGTAILSKLKPLQVINGFPKDIVKKFKVSGDTYGDPNLEGRVIAAEFEKFWVVTVYTPNAKDDLSRLDLREKHWDPAFLAYVKQLEKSKPVLFCGDLNVAHTPDDLANPKPNEGKKGFTAEERQGFQNFIDAGFLDTFRLFKQGNGHYSWWTHFANARARNVGWRIDYFLASESLRPKIKNAEIHSQYMGSDHCPVSVTLDM